MLPGDLESHAVSFSNGVVIIFRGASIQNYMSILMISYFVANRIYGEKN